MQGTEDDRRSKSSNEKAGSRSKRGEGGMAERNYHLRWFDAVYLTLQKKKAKKDKKSKKDKKDKKHKQDEVIRRPIVRAGRSLVTDRCFLTFVKG